MQSPVRMRDRFNGHKEGEEEEEEEEEEGG
jgi:hypothetical protein